MIQAMVDVMNFHNACSVPVLDHPEWPAEARIELRKDILEEEYKELMSAIQSRDMVKTADGIADLIYVAIGTALEFGIPIDRVWAEVQRANMAKRDPATGRVRYREDGKVLKPEGWTPPNIAEIVLR